MTFDQLGLIEPILKALATEGYTHPTPIQQQGIPILLQRRDLLGCAQTGTGKTAAFALPILQLLHESQPAKGSRGIKTLILTPTRELAIQIGESFTAYGRNLHIRHTVIFGGVGQNPQTEALKKGVEILIATPGRLLDLMQQGFVHLNQLDTFVLDEADRMLDMGFIHDVRKVIAKLPTKRQTLFFSATMPPEISKLAESILTQPVRIEVTPVSSTAEKVSQTIWFVEKKDKKGLMIQLLQDTGIKSALVFTRTKHGANKVAKDLAGARISAEAIHGNKSQNARQAALGNFKNGKTRVLVATDIAARGIDIDDLAYVFNYDLPNIPETYVHRIGRTGRAGASGQAISFCDTEERAFLRDIEKLIGQKVPVAGTITPSANTADSGEEREPRAPRPESRRSEPRRQPVAQNKRPEQKPEPTPRHQNARPQQPTRNRQETTSSAPNTQTPRHQNARPQQPGRNRQETTSEAPNTQTQRPDNRPPFGERNKSGQNRQQNRSNNERPPQQRNGSRPEPTFNAGKNNTAQPVVKTRQEHPRHTPKPAPKQQNAKSDWNDLDEFTW